MSRSEDLQENSYLVTFDVKETGVRLDRFLKDRYRKRSRETLKRAIDEGAIFVLREQSPHLQLGKLKASSLLIAGDQVQVLSERRPEPEVSFDYKIIYEDETLFVIDKPANLPVHPAGRYFFNTLLVHLKTRGQGPRPAGLAERAKLTRVRSEAEYFLVHRIDKETSGVLVLAKDREVCAHLTKQFAERKTEKRYLAIVRGITPDEFAVDAPMRRSTNSLVGLKMVVAPESDGGQTAFTRFKRLDTAGDFSLVECFPKTGRQHQIRVHLDHAGHPIVGDKLYGMSEQEAFNYYERKQLSAESQARLLLPRHALHAAGIRFQNPSTGQMVEFASELPQDLSEFLESQRS